MSLLNITSANSTVSATILGQNVPFEAYGTDRKWIQEFVEYIERERSADGHLVLAYVPQILDIRFTFNAASPTIPKLNELDMAQRLAQAPLTIPVLTITVPSIGYRFQCVNGAMFGKPLIPSAAKKLDPVEVGFTFDKIIPMPI